MTTLGELKRRAKAGDLEALQALRDSGFFQKQKAAKEGYVVSHAQKRLWILEQMEDKSAAYNIPSAIQLDGPLDIKAFTSALEAVVARHESLRTTFASINNEPRQIIHEEGQFQLEKIDLRTEHETETMAQKYAYQDAASSFDLQNGPLLRAKLLKLTDNQHVFLFNIHHIVCDAWSMGVIVREVMTLYAAYLKGLENPLPPLKIQYKDYAAWQNAQLEGQEVIPHRRYWHRKLLGQLPVLNLPTDYPRPPVLTFAGKTLSVHCDSLLADQLGELGREHGASLFMTLVALVKVLLYRYTGQPDIIIGTPIAGRDHPDLEDQIGCFVNTLALRDRLAGENSFVQVLKCVKQTAEAAYEHQIYPFDLLVNELDLNRDMSRSPIFDVMVVLQNTETTNFSLGEVKISEFDSGFSVAKFDLTFEFVETSEGLWLVLNYNTNLFSEPKINNMVGHFKQLLLSIMENVHTPISTLNILSPTEKQCLLVEFNNTRTNYPRDKTLIALFEEQVDKTPDNIAIIFAEEENLYKRITYRELNEQANCVAWHLIKQHKVKTDERIAVLLERSDWMVVGLLGILKAGGAYVPVDPSYPDERIHYMLEDSGCRVVLTKTRYIPMSEYQEHTENAKNTSVISESSKHLDGNHFNWVDIHTLPTESSTNPPLLAQPDHAAYIIYTSGSTGQPKGCLITHRNVVRLMKNDQNRFDFNQEDVWVVAHSFGFDFSVWEMYGALLNGGKAIIAKPEEVQDVESFIELLKRHRVTVLNQTPAAFYNLIETEGTSAQPHLDEHLRYVIFGGDRLEPTYLRAWIKRYPLDKIKLINMYGITETTVHVTYYQLREEDILGTAGKSPIGMPLPETTVYVCNEQLALQPIGISGELYVGGSGVSQGYLNKPDLTAKRFITSPYREGEQLYRTGDLGCWLEKGTLEYLGRNDDQVQVRGFRVELGEIEQRLLEAKMLEKAVVLARESNGIQELVAYLVALEPLHVPSLRHHLSQKLPDYMIPTHFILVDEILLTSNGKVDKRALLQLTDNRYQLSEETFVAPRTPMEERLADLWANILGVERVGIHDDFFELGGHSLKGTQLVSKIRSDLEIKMGLRDLFEFSTIAELAEVIQNQQPTAFIQIEPVPIAEHYAVSNAQRRLWVLERMGADIAAYNITSSNLLEGQINVEALEKALQILVARHEPLRTTLIEFNEEPRQVINKSIDFKIEIVDLTVADNPEPQAQQLVNQEAAKAYDLKTGPLFKVKLYHLGPERYVFLLGMHHIISDGWSLEIFVKELLILYKALVAKQKNPLPPLRIQYKDYAQWQNALLADTKTNNHRDYWLKQFSGEIPILELPTDYPRPLVQTFRGGMQTLLLSSQQTSHLKKLGQAQGASFFMTLLALVKILMYRYTGQEDIIIGSPVAGREHPDLANQIGFYVNMLALRDTIQVPDTFVRVLDKVKKTVTNAFDHQIYPFDRLVEELELKRDMGRNPLFDVAISLVQSLGGIDSELSTLKILPFEFEIAISKFDLTFVFGELADGRCEVGIEYSTDLFSPERMERMATHLSELVNSVLEAPHQAISHLNILPQWERQKVLVEFNDTYSDYPRDKTIAKVFEAQVEKTPDNLAVICGETQLTYQALNQRANSLARLLREKYRIEPEECVGVLLDRSEWTVVALVSILKAGGAYVPIDPAYPHNRIAYILKDTGCRIVLSEPKHMVGMLSNLPDIQAIAIKKLDKAVGSNLKSVGNSSSLAYVIYTSGSTGLPKGSLIKQKSVLRLVLNTNYININESDRILQTGSLAFDASTFEIWGALLNGACLCLPSDDVLLEAGELKHLMTHHGITTMFLTTGLFNQFVEADISLFKDLKTLLMGGEKVSVRHVNRLRETYPTVELKHVYGPTENTTFTTYYPVKGSCERDVPIGYPITNTTVYLLDGKGQPAPLGVPGEICTGGDGLARGYLNQPALTNEKFVPNPFKIDEQLYRTGDLGYWLSDGNIVFIGRIDNQVKVRGFRIEPGEIEERLLKHPAVKEAVVIARETTVGTQELIAYVSSETALTVAELRSHLAEALPNYMIPVHIVCIDQLPLNVNGKVDKRALPEPETTEAESSTTYVAPNSHEEKILANIWEGVLSQKPISVHDNYFELGGDSIKAIQIASRLMREGWKMEVRDLFHNPTIAELAPRLRQIETQPEQQDIIIGQVPLTAIQRWFFTNHCGDLHHFNQAVLLRSQERLNENTVRQVLQQLQEHHDALRMTYPKIADVSPTLAGDEMAILQINAGLEQPLSFEVVDLTGTANEIKDLESHAHSVQSSLVLEIGPLMKVVLYQLTTGSRLLLVIHHLIVDGVSWRILIEDIEQGYRQAIAGNEIHFGAKTVSFKHWAEEIQRYATGEVLLQENNYWSSILENTIVSPLPRDFELESEENLYKDCQSVSINLSESETQSLMTGTHHAYNTEMNDILLTALGRALKRWHGGETTLITMEGHGREALDKSLDVSRTVGWFTSMFPFFLKTPGDDIGHQVKSVKEAWRHIPNKGIGFGILSHVTRKSQQKKNQVFSSNLIYKAQLSFNYLGQFDDGGDNGLLTFADESFGQLISPNLQRHHDLDVSGIIVHDQLILSITFNTDRHQPITIEQLLTDFKQELLAVVEHCQHKKTGEKTPSDFTVPIFSLDEYNAFLKANAWVASQIEDIYPLSPMQEGLLFESLYNADSTAYFVQMSYRLNGALLIESFKQSWYELTRRYAVLRTAFVHENVASPLQIVFKDRLPEIRVMDWRDLTEIEQSARLEAFLFEDMKQGFDFQHGTLMRITIFQLSESQHQIVWSYHHLLLDGWCLSIVYQDFIQIYAALCDGKTPKLPVTPPYSEYIRWLEDQDKNEAINYWSHYLSGYEHVTTLPKWHRSEPMSDYVLKEKTFALGDIAKLKALAASQGVTVNTIIQSVWGVILSRHNNVDDVVFGTIVSGRPTTLGGVEKMVGLFINAIPVRIQCQANQTFLELLQAVQKAALESELYHHVPLADILTRSQVGRDIFDHLLVFQNYVVAEEFIPENSSRAEFEIDRVQVHDQTHYDFNLIVSPSDLIIRCSYNSNIYDNDQIERIAAHLQTAFRHIIQSPEQLIGQINILPDWELKQLIHTFNDTATEYPWDKTIVDLFEEQVAKTPEVTAVIFEKSLLTYQELNTRANQLAYYLQSLGVGPDRLVGICIERSLEMVIGLLGILKAGGAYVPLDPGYPQERITFMLEDAQVPVLLTQEKLKDSLSGHNAQVICFNTDWVHISQYSKNNPATSLLPDNLAYVIYTSGSTGQPKGVMNTHIGIFNRLLWMQEVYKLTQDDSVLQKTPFSFDVSVWEFFWPLITGAKLVVAKPGGHQEPDYLINTIIEHQITTLHFVPSMLRIFLEAQSVKQCQSLKRVICSGEALSVELQKYFFECLEAELHNLYGPTEAAVDVTYWQCHPDDNRLNLVPIGQPIANTQIYILDKHLQPVPIGVAGELHIGGLGLARGYWNRPELTAEKFIPNPFSSKPKARLYKTGDLARYLTDGNIEYLDRIDHQVKIRGFRIELGEIENRLLQHELVKSAVVVTKERKGGEKELVAYLVMHGEWKVTTLRNHLENMLPDYMIPSFFVPLEKIPLTPNGKIDKKALPDPTTTDIDRTTEYMAPRDELEEQLTHIWQAVLPVEKIGIFDNFFELGGHSLKVVQVGSRIHQTLGIKIALPVLFNLPTIAQLASRLKTAEEVTFSSIQPAVPQEYYDLSYAQKRLWILHQMGESASVAYNMPQVFLFKETLDTEALKKAFATLVDRHEVLRTAFVEIEGEPRQKIYPSIDFSVSEVVSTGANVDEKAQERVDKDTNTAFDLIKPPLLRATLVKISENRYVFILTIHHIIGDGWSMNILYQEIMALYNAYRLNMPNPLKPLRIQYKDFAVWQNAKGFEREEQYWLTKLARVPQQLRLPYDFLATEERNFRGDVEKMFLEANITQGLQTLARQKQTTISNVMLALFKLLLFQLTKQEDFCVGLGIANRNHPELENLIGFFVNTLPIRTHCSEDMEFEELLQQVNQSTQEALEYQDYPLDWLVNKLNPRRVGNRQPLFNVVYAFQNETNVYIDVGTGEKEIMVTGDLDNPKGLDISFKISKFDLTLVVTDYGNTLHLYLEYDTGLFLPTTIQRYLAMLRHFARIVAS